MATRTASLVHTKETSTPPITPLTYQDFSRRFLHAEYLAAERVYSVLDNRKDKTRADILRGCRTSAWFARHRDTGEVRVAANSCHLRWCPVCAKSRQNYVTHEVTEWLRIADHPKFLTLTMRHSNAPLCHQVYWLYKHFQVLRRRKDFNAAVKGGIWFFQIKKSRVDSRWHPHLHCLVTGLYIPQRRLSHMWAQVTFGSVVVDIRAIHDPERAARDAARYCSCPGSLVGLSVPEACELVSAMHGRRICGTWGTGRAVSLRPPKSTDRSKWEDIGGFTIVANMRGHDADADEIWTAWRQGTVLKAGVKCNALERLLSEAVDFDWCETAIEEIYKHERSPP